MTFKMANKPRTITVFNLRADTKEFIGEGDAYIQPFTGLPAHCTTVSPPAAKRGFVAIFDDAEQAWSEHEDHRGTVVYDVATGQEIYITEPGPLPPGTTGIAPGGAFEKWDGSAWIKDEMAERQALVESAENQKAEMLKVANDTIAPLQDAVELDMATDEEIALLGEMKKYRVLLSRVDTSNAPDIAWPVEPVNVA
jgi:phage terminase large subunit GpA-like protein